MGIIDRIKDAVSPDDPEEPTSAHPEASGPAAASGDTAMPAPAQSSSGGGQASEAGSGFSEVETSAGGADAVPDTPDDVPENYT